MAGSRSCEKWERWKMTSPITTRLMAGVLVLALAIPGCDAGDDPAGLDQGAPDAGVVKDIATTPDTLPPPDSGTDGPKGYMERCVYGQTGACQQGLVCVRLQEQTSTAGYCSAVCTSVACPSSPPGGQCLFKRSDGSKLCGFVCDGSNPHCPNGLGCTYLSAAAMYFCSGDPLAKCGNSKLEPGEDCDGSMLDNMSCKAFGYTGGTLGCNASSCKFDTTACTGTTACKLPPRNCSSGADCTKLEEMLPRTGGDGFKVYTLPIWGWLRKDTWMLVKHAVAAVKCVMPGSWPISMCDGSEKDGATPKFSDGTYRHPPGSHVNGVDIDIAYYQTGRQDNDPRPVCPYKNPSGTDVNHCMGAPDTLDLGRSTFLLAKLSESGRMRAMGVDGQIGLLVKAEADKLYKQKLISTRALNTLKLRLAYEITNTNKGWFYSHHHHVHVSTYAVAYADAKTSGTASYPPGYPAPAGAGLPPSISPNDTVLEGLIFEPPKGGPMNGR